MPSLLIHHIKEILAVEDQMRPYKRGAEMREMPRTAQAWLKIENGKIQSFGSGNPPTADQKLDAQGGLLLPAFVDSHTHLVYAANREDEFAQRLAGKSYAEIAAAGGGILNSAQRLRETSEEELYQSAAARLKDLIRMGTGAIEIKSGYGLDLASELKMLRVATRLQSDFPVAIKRSFLAAHAVPPEFTGRRKDYVQHIINDMLPAVVEEELADYIDAFCEEGYFDTEDTLALVQAAAQYGLEAKIHINQFTHAAALKPLIDAGALSLDHLEMLNQDELEYLAESNTIATALPGCSLFLGIPYTPGRAIIDAGGILAVASDFNPGSAPSGNMLLQMSLASTQMKLLPEEALCACTLNGAAALGLSEQLGSIEVGKVANLLISRPGLNLASLPYHFGHTLIDSVILKGEIWS